MNSMNLLTSEQVAEKLALKTSSLAQMRWRGDKRLPWVKMGRIVRYKAKDVQSFIESSTIC